MSFNDVVIPITLAFVWIADNNPVLELHPTQYDIKYDINGDGEITSQEALAILQYGITGAKTRYEIYMSKLDPKSRKDEMYIENEYTKQLRAWNAAISKYGSKYDLDPFPGPSR